MAMIMKIELSLKLESFKHILLLVLILCSAETFGAGFDCSKAKIMAEKRICASEAISHLDEELSAQYKMAVRTANDSGHLVAGQRKWIAETRNRCADEPCLSDVYKARIAWLKNSSAGDAAICNVGEEQIIGNWRRLKSGDFEEFAIDIANGKRNFSSWLHHRPEYMGKWDLKSCKLHIANSEDRLLDFDYKVLGLQDEVLYLRSSEDGEESSYRRIRK